MGLSINISVKMEFWSPYSFFYNTHCELPEASLCIKEPGLYWLAIGAIRVTFQISLHENSKEDRIYEG